MDKESYDILKMFQIEDNRKIEEEFALTLTEKSYLRLFFVNENQAFTDGKNIVVDPAVDNLFCDTDALRKTEEFLKLPESTSVDPFVALKMITRGQVVHEALHIIYTNFPLDFLKSKYATNKFNQMILSSISNVIEDAFIEAAGASEYDNMALFLQFGRVSRLFANTPSEGTIQRSFEEFLDEEDKITTKRKRLSKKEKDIAKKMYLLMEYIDYFATMLLYPMVALEEPSKELKSYIKQTESFFEEASICPNADKRNEYVDKIFECIKPLIPDIRDKEVEEYAQIEKMVEAIVGGNKIHSGGNMSIGKYSSKGKEANITRRLFTNEKDDFSKQYLSEIIRFDVEKKASLFVVNVPTLVYEYTAKALKASNIHRKITVKVIRPKPNLNLKKAYENIYSKYVININSYNAKFSELLKGNTDIIEDKYVFGHGISSKNLGDVKKRYWYRKSKGIDVPDIAILFLIDGSGSMMGIKNNNSIVSSVILHEVLAKNGIEHAIVEHRAVFDEPLVEHNVLIDFDFSKNDKYNILKLGAYDGTREGLSLLWADKYLKEHSSAEHKVIIAISDGLPCHSADDEDEYFPPVSIWDSKNVVKRIEKSGTNVIAIALEDSVGTTECYDDLKKIYSSVIDVDDPRNLTTQLFKLVARLYR